MATQNPTVSTSVLTGKVAAIGTVKMVIGTVSATSSDGVVRVLQVGDKVNANDVIQTGDLASIDIEFVNGTHMDLGRNAQTVLDTDVFNPAAAQAAVADAAAIQALIAAGADPTAIAAATAAGAGEASEGGHSFVQVDPNYAPGNVTSGFETDVVTRTFLATEGQVLGPVTQPEAPPSPPNLPPVAAPDLYTTAEDVPLVISAASGVLANDTDVDSDPLTVVSNTAPTNGTVALNANGSFTYTPNADYNGPDSFTYTISDGQGGTDTATVAITVTPVNDPPVAENDPPVAAPDLYTTAEDVPLVISAASGVLANDTDVDSDPLTVVSNTAPTNGTVALNANGSFTYTPNADYNGPDSFTYTISDGQGGMDTATVAITVTPVNDPFILNGVITTNTSHVPRSMLLTFTDSTDPAHTFQKVIDVPTGGQQDTQIAINENVGFSISPSTNYIVTLEYVSGGKIIVTDATLEGAIWLDGAGNWPLGDGSQGTNHAVTGVITGDNLATPLSDGQVIQSATDSTDGTTGNNALTDPSGTQVNYLWGDAGNDNLSSSNTGSGVIAPAGDILNGGSGNDALTGNAGNDILNGGPGDDMLVGGIGADALAGGSGSDALTGGSGSDTFTFKAGDTGVDTITDFTVGAGGDVLDVSDVLSGTGVTSSNVGAFIIFDTTSSPGNTVVSVDLDGTGGGAPVQLAILQGVTFADPGQALTTLLGNNQIDYTNP